MEPIGLIAGQGELPLIVARGMRAANRRVICIGLRNQFDPSLPALCDSFHVAGLAQLGRWIRLLRAGGAREAVMIGRVAKSNMHDPWRLIRHIPDLRAIRLWYRRLRHDRRTHVVLAALAEELESSGIPLINSTAFILDHMATVGPMGSVLPNTLTSRDVSFGWALLSRAVDLDIGQALIVREGDIVAVEALEGTDAMIDRAAALCGRARGWTLLKTSKHDHDLRSDVPTIGVATVERVARLGGACIGVGAGKVILVDRPQVIAAANRLGICILGLETFSKNTP
ncbi:MAG: UDP-2,3-diacylglucosamine diphosphatase LpxI [Planctomycetota bacterium]|nr:UDP-2,3-diacylglucosamine diphosphatase LpxI [Planctomycetota bacterium]